MAEVLKWLNPGYHLAILRNGVVVQLLPIEKVANGVAGYNSNSIHISYIGGVDKQGKAVDNRTPEQIDSMIGLIKKYKALYPKAKVLGHRDFPGVKKECPSFDVKTWLECVGL